MKERFKLLLLLMLPVMAFANKGDSEFKRTIVKELSGGSSANLSISNKYGKIIIHTWNKSGVKATITVTGFGKSVEEAQNSANMVDIEEGNSNGNLSLQTVYHPGVSGGRLFNWGNRKDSKDYVNIDYEVYVPEDLRRIQLDNNFGDVITDVLSFPAVLSLNYCNYDIREAQKSLQLNLNYCDKGRLGKGDMVSIHSNYSNLKCDNITSLSARSNYSDYDLGTVGTIDVHSNYDDYKIVKLGSLTTNCTYSDFKIEELQSDLDMKLVYGDLKVNEVGSGFKGGNMQLTYSDVKLLLTLKVGIQVSAQLNNGNMKTAGLSMKNESIIKKNSHLSYSATTPGGNESSPALNISGTYSDVELRSR